MTNGARHRGLTLVEVLLVLALLVAIGAIVAPLMEGAFTRASLQNSGDLVRAAWGRARLAAMESGQTHVFRFEFRGSRYLITTLDAFGSGAGEPPPDFEDSSRNAIDIIRKSESRLPDGIIFAAGDVASSSRVQATLGQMPTGSWSPPIVFHPDGTTADATVLLANDEQQTVRVTLRGLTGLSNASEVGHEPLPPQ
ncbi:MAG: prepilin-type N-terminal cleavage/methylation domain-containing protein [Pirellulales bacterium]